MMRRAAVCDRGAPFARGLRHLIVFALFVIAAGCSTIPRPGVGAASAGPPPYEAWAETLERFVDSEGRVDFRSLATQRATLDRFVAWVYDHGPATRPQEFPTPAHVLAFHLNAYNALAMHQVIEFGVPESLAGLAKVRFFALAKVAVAGVPISLYDYENKVIRTLGDERVHVALNCMSVGCPRLPRTPFLADTLDQALQRESHLFFNDPRHVAVDHARRVTRLSEILAFFPEDFLAKAPTLIDYVNRYRSDKIDPAYRVEFIPYDWTINRQR